MNFYSRYILPKLINGLMQNKSIAEERSKIIPKARGVVLEIGGGSGTNVPYYSNIEKLIIIEPSEELIALARNRINSSTIPIKIITSSAEKINLEDNSIDTVVSTWTLCSIPDVEQALREVYRVLKPGGIFLFIEHGRSLNKKVAWFQRWATPLWKHVAGGCHLDRKIDELILAAGFKIQELKVEYSAGLRTAGYMYKGEAVKVLS